MQKKNILITSMGGTGALNLHDTLARSELGPQLRFFGSHVDPNLLIRSPGVRNYIVPKCKEADAYMSATNKIIEKEKIDLLIPKSDLEARVIAQYRDQLQTNLLLPDFREIDVAQDKYSFFLALKKHNVPTADTVLLNSLEEIDEAFGRLQKADRYWIRIKTAGAAGSLGATWFEKIDTAKTWISIWKDLNGTDISEFTICEFLPGRVLEVLTLFHNGEVKLAKVIENVEFHEASTRISGMGSPPALAQTVSDDAALKAAENAIAAVQACAKEAGTKANGVYHLTTKQNSNGDPCVTESNIGRFPVISACFDRIGKYKLAEYYVRYGLGMVEQDPDNYLDLCFEPTMLIRTLDRPMMAVPVAKKEKLITIQ